MNVMYIINSLPTKTLMKWSIFDTKIARTCQDILRDVFWSIANGLMGMIQSILDALINGVLSLDVFTNSTFVTTTFKFSLALMFLLIPMKLIYEIVTAMIRDDDAGMDVNKKVGSAVFGIMIACSLTVGVTKVINPLVKNGTQQMLAVNLVDSDGATTEQAQIGDTLLETVLVSFGGMPTEGDYGARSLVEKYQDDDFSIKERYESDETDESTGETTHKKYEYKWDFSEFLTIIGFAIYLIMLLIITIQIGNRTIAILFYYLIGPLCCASLTNYQNPQAFTVWRNSLISQWLMNTCQIFLLTIMVAMIDAIANATTGYPIATACLYFGALSLVISAPNFVSAMVGGYSSGIMDTLRTLGSMGRGVKGTAKVTGAVAGAGVGALKTAGKGAVMFGSLAGSGLKQAGEIGKKGLGMVANKLGGSKTQGDNQNKTGSGVNADVFGKDAGSGVEDMSRQGSGSIKSMGDGSSGDEGGSSEDMTRQGTSNVISMGDSSSGAEDMTRQGTSNVISMGDSSSGAETVRKGDVTSSLGNRTPKSSTAGNATATVKPSTASINSTSSGNTMTMKNNQSMNTKLAGYTTGGNSQSKQQSNKNTLGNR